jgi:hypothetical protein
MYIFLINIGEVEIFESISPIFNANIYYMVLKEVAASSSDTLILLDCLFLYHIFN